MTDVLRPNPGPQEAFLSTAADIAIYGGAAGSGKSFATALDPLRHVHRKGYGAIVFRREATRLVGPGSIWEETSGIYPAFGAKARESPVLEWRFPSGALMEFRHLQHEKDRLGHSGKQYAGIYFDELTEFEESQFWFLLSRNRSTCGVRPYVRATCNPDPDSFVRRLIDWWIGGDGLPIQSRSAVLRWFVRDGHELVWADTEAELLARYPDRSPLSLTFVAASLSDNPKGDPSYRDKLNALPLIERSRLLGGNWNMRAEAGTVFNRTWFRDFVDAPPTDVVRWVRAWDLAATEKTASNDPDWTEGVLVGITKPRPYRDTTAPCIVIADLVSAQVGPGSVEELYRVTADRDGANVTQAFWQDPGQAGKDQAQRIQRVLGDRRVETMPATQNKIAYAKLWSAAAEQGRVIIVRADWNARLISQAQSFPTAGVHDDIIDAVSRGAHALTQPVERRTRFLTVRGI